MFMKFPKQEKGQGLVEYALILVLVAIVVIAVLLIVGPAISRVYGRVTAALSGETVILSGGAISDIDSNFDPTFGSSTGDLAVVVTVSENTEVTVTLDDGSALTKNCSGSCTFNFSDVPNSGFITATDSSGGEGVTASWG